MSVDHLDRPLAAIGMRLAATLLLSAMFAIAKLVQDRGVGLIEVLFVRQSVMVLPVVALAAAGAGLASLKTKQPRAHFRRIATGLSGMALNFAAVGMLPLAEAQSIWFAIPLFATVLGALWLGERVGWHRWAATVLGFIGVLVVLQPGGTALPLLGTGVAVASALVTSVTAILIRQLGRTESALTTVFWFGLISSAVLAVPFALVARPHDAETWALLLLMGIVGGAGQITLTLSLRFAAVSVVAPVDYASLIWAIVFGALLFGDWPGTATWVGTPLVIASGIYIVIRERRLARAATAGATPD